MAVDKAVKAGRIKRVFRNGRPFFDWEKNRDSFIATTTKPPERYFAALSKLNASTNRQPERIDCVREPVDKEFSPIMKKLEAESMKQIYLAKQAKLKFLKDSGLLIDVQTVRRDWEEIAVRVQKAMLAIPDRVAEIFASVDDAEKIRFDLEKEIRYALSNLQYNAKVKNERVEKIVEDESEDEHQNEDEE
jgi:hypothetical protein